MLVFSLVVTILRVFYHVFTETLLKVTALCLPWRCHYQRRKPVCTPICSWHFRLRWVHAVRTGRIVHDVEEIKTFHRMRRTPTLRMCSSKVFFVTCQRRCIWLRYCWGRVRRSWRKSKSCRGSLRRAKRPWPPRRSQWASSEKSPTGRKEGGGNHHQVLKWANCAVIRLSSSQQVILSLLPLVTWTCSSWLGMSTKTSGLTRMLCQRRDLFDSQWEPPSQCASGLTEMKLTTWKVQGRFQTEFAKC